MVALIEFSLYTLHCTGTKVGRPMYWGHVQSVALLTADSNIVSNVRGTLYRHRCNHYYTSRLHAAALCLSLWPAAISDPFLTQSSTGDRNCHPTA